MLGLIRRMFTKKSQTTTISFPEIEPMPSFDHRVSIHFNEEAHTEMNHIIRHLFDTYGDKILIERKFMIPVDGLSLDEAKKSITQLIPDYKEDIFISEGSVNIPYKKDYWL